MELEERPPRRALDAESKVHVVAHVTAAVFFAATAAAAYAAATAAAWTSCVHAEAADGGGLTNEEVQACIGDPRAGYLAHLRAMHAYGVLLALLWIFDGLVFGTMGLVEWNGTPLGCLQPLEEAAEREDREVALKDARAASAAAAAASGGGVVPHEPAPLATLSPASGRWLLLSAGLSGVHANSGWAMLILSLIPPAYDAAFGDGPTPARLLGSWLLLHFLSRSPPSPSSSSAAAPTAGLRSSGRPTSPAVPTSPPSPPPPPPSPASLAAPPSSPPFPATARPKTPRRRRRRRRPTPAAACPASSPPRCSGSSS